ncbi:MAG: hypothetical protein ABSH35_09540 [Isosphaeraceae bacterium]
MQRQGIDRARIPAQALWAAGRGDKVVEGTSPGSGSTVGDRAFVLDSTFPAGTQIPAGAIYEKTRWSGSSSGEDEPRPARRRPSLMAHARAC